MDILKLLHKTPLPVIIRMQIERNYIINTKNIKRLTAKKLDNISTYYPLVRNNRFYGNEELLRKYSNINEDLYAIIEHGLYFGNNTQRVGNDFEWELGCVLTNGKYRKELLNKYYPDYYCETIGPLIHYAKTDQDFKENLRSKLKNNKRTLLFFPVHGNEYFSPKYDTESTIRKIIKIADEHDCYNIIICVYYGNFDLFNEIVKKIGNNRILISTCGNRYDSNFLCKQRAMIELSDLTISNNLGTHLGYCIYLKKNHILLPQDFSYEGDSKAISLDFGDANRSKNWSKDYKDETRKFQLIFNESQEEITREQMELCDYYWGFSEVKSPEDIVNIYHKCKRYAKTFPKRGS